MMHRRLLRSLWIAGALVFSTLGTLAYGQGGFQDYPKTDLVTRLRSGRRLAAEGSRGRMGAMPGVTIGPSVNVWTFNRGNIQIQIYTSMGRWSDRGARTASSRTHIRSGSTPRATSGLSTMVQTLSPSSHPMAKRCSHLALRTSLARTPRTSINRRMSR